MLTFATREGFWIRRLVLALAIGFSVFAFSVFGASHTSPVNLPPTVFFTTAPDNGGSIPYRSEFAWSGTDPDPVDGIVHFEYALDPPSAFTAEEIAHPETAPGVTVTVRPGSESGRDTIEVSKDVNDTLYTFSWIGTPDANQEFVFETPIYQSFLLRYAGQHRLYLRGQDDGGLYSEPDSRQFTALNDAPENQIVYPIPIGILSLGPSVYVRANGNDPDPVSTTGRPVAYLTKLLRLDTMNPPVSFLNAPVSLLMEGGDSTWAHHDGGEPLQMTFPVDVPGSYLFGVRAVDENGGTEQFLLFGRNAIKFQASATGGRPVITLNEPSTGTFRFFVGQAPAEEDAPANTPLDFSWLAISEAYGIDAYSWGVDLADPSSETGWTPWNPDLSTGAPVQFPGGETHTFHVRARDIVGSITTGTLVLHMIEMTFDRQVLLVDDSFDNLNPRDSEHDAFWQDLVDNYVANSDLPADQVFTFAVHGDGDRGNLQPDVPLLGDLGRYKAIVWENAGWGYNGESALVKSTAISPRLAAYLRAGGKLWLGGRATVAATTADANDVGADLTYPKTELGPGDFAWDFLKLQSTKINNNKGQNTWDLLHSVWPFPGVPAVYDSMVVDLSKLSLLQQGYGGFAYADAVFDPLNAEADPGFEGDIDTLYAYGAAGPEVGAHSSSYQGRLCALRWHDSDPNREHGRVQWFGFSLYYMQLDQARKTFNQSMDWLRQEDGVVPVSHLTFSGLRDGDRAVIRWQVTEGWENAVFLVYREEPGHEREKMSAFFSGASQYEFVDRHAPSGTVSYWINEQDRTGSLVWHGPITLDARSIETGPMLAPVLPNPVAGSAQLVYSLPRAGPVSLSVHDVSGRQVAILVNDTQDAGRHELTWHPSASGGGRLAAGFYVIRLQTGTAREVRKVLVLP